MSARSAVHAAGRQEAIRDYYARVLTRSRDLKTGACCPPDALPAAHRRILDEIHPEVLARFYGCGSPIPPLLDGTTVVDLGCGSGRDAFLAAKLAGPAGRVLGIDMTEAQLAVARRHADAQCRRFGFDRPNVEFRLGYIEDMAAADVADESVDVVISNCVINLSPDKPRVFAEIFRVLKPGGELYFSDVFASRRTPVAWMDDPVLVGECLAGAMYVGDFRRSLRSAGCRDYREVARARVAIEDAEIDAKVGGVEFHSLTVRAFKLDTLEDACEDYGQIATYRGTIPDHPHRFELDPGHAFVTGKPTPVCGNTASMLTETRYARHFEVLGDRSTHYGLFACATSPAGSQETGGACC
jgi:SAM-dependent methyltransferase